MYDIKALWQPRTVAEACDILRANPKARLIAGGTDILIRMHEGKLHDAELVSIYGLDVLQEIKLTGEGSLRIGSGASFTRVMKNESVRKCLPVLGEAVSMVGGPQTRNAATIGGNICNGATSADSASTLFACNARLEITNGRETRLVPISEFYLGPGKVALKQDEILMAIVVEKADYEGFAGNYVKYAMRKALDIATLGVVSMCKLADDGETIADYRLAFGVAAPTPIRCPKSEALVKGRKLSAELLEQLGETVITEISPRTSWRATREFRIQLARELSKRTLQVAYSKAGGK
ncbi:MAG: xanthine dehydrogenase FAD-binding subunit XdhB [Negativicutes bacterium]|nr:xanthine dehydrogenase FAD-binding subunit XdhB [Negativicutes bacterium]